MKRIDYSDYHHVPPKAAVKRGDAKLEDQFVIRKNRGEHQAYHALFGTASSFAECVEELEKVWDAIEVFDRLFGDCETFTECKERLRREWWTRPAKVIEFKRKKRRKKKC